MKHIISFNEEYLDITLVRTLKDDENPVEAMKSYIQERINELFDQSKDEPMDEDALEMFIHDDNVPATIRYDEYNEYIKIIETPDEPLSVKTSAGTLRAYTSKDPQMPGISLMLQPAGFNEEVDLAYACVYEDQKIATNEKETANDVCIFAWGDIYSEDYTEKHILRESDIHAALKGE